MKKFLIPVLLIDKLKDRQKNTFIQPHRKEKSGELALYNKNGMCYYWFKNVKPAQNHFAMIGERFKCPRYLKKSIIEI